MPLFIAGVLTGTLGTLIGAGGGFVMVPLLIFFYPQDSAELITAISLAVVFFNAFSGTVAYARLKRIDYKSAIPFIVASLPGSFLGVELARHFARTVFDPVFGVSLCALAIYLLTRTNSAAKPLARGRANSERTLIMSNGEAYSYAFDMRLGLAISALTGFLSSVLGIGGGIIHVPAMVHWLNFPVHVATATSHLTVMVMALVATLQHLHSGVLDQGIDRILYLAPGVVLGAQLGAYLSLKVRDLWILKLLALALLAVGFRLVLLR